ncbi:MAG: SH3 domain-containing protein, partial [Caldilineaceae bacterium]
MKRARINTAAQRPMALLLPIVAFLLVTGVIGTGWMRVRAAQPQPSQALPEQAFTPTIDPFFLTLTPGFISPLATPTVGPTPTSTPTIDPTSIEVRSATVNAASGANLRSAANVNADVVSVLQNGAVYVVSQGPLTGGDAAQWVELALPGGSRGWIMANLVT